MTLYNRPNVIDDAADAEIPVPEFMRSSDGGRLLYLLRHEHGDHPIIVQFIAARAGEGTSSMARDLALIAARDFGLRVLLLDLLGRGESSQFSWFDQHYRGHGAQAIRQWDVPDPEGLQEMAQHVAIYQLGRHPLWVSENDASWNPGWAHWTNIFPPLLANFDLILVDSPALERHYDGIMISPHVTANLIVIEAEATRAAVVQNLRDRILEVKGVIAGTLLNKRQFYIPEAIYKRL